MTADGEPFFWLADTAWELFHRLDERQAETYLDFRKAQGFNVVQAVVLAELDGIHSPNANGDLPFTDLEHWEYNEAYFSHVDRIISMAEHRGIHMALLPTWGDKLFKNSWGIGPEIFNPERAYAYGKWIGNRYKDRKNLIWVLGGDRNPRDNSDDLEVWNQMAKGILETQNPENPILITFHPQPAEPGGSSNWFHQAEWLSFNMHQTGHCPDQPTYQKIAHDLSLSPQKPTIDGEPMYEEHPKCFNAKELGYSEAADIRRIMYWNVFAGAAGQTAPRGGTDRRRRASSRCAVVAQPGLCAQWHGRDSAPAGHADRARCAESGRQCGRRGDCRQCRAGADGADRQWHRRRSGRHYL